MGKKERSVTLFLEEIMDAMEKILRFVRAYDEERFTSDEVMSDAVIKNLMIIGEAAKNIPKSIQNRYKHIPWDEMYGLRNVIIHDYFETNLKVIWQIISEELPATYEDMQSVMKDIKSK